MKTSDEIMIKGQSLTEILRLHGIWRMGGIGGIRADLSGNDMRGADLSWANLSGADLSGADMRGNDMRWANLSGANISGANISGADLSGARYEYKGANAKRFNVFNNLYRYCVIPIIDIDNNQFVRMGCKFHTREEWEAGKGDNKGEFPDDGSEKSELRKFALATAFSWLDLVAKQIEKETEKKVDDLKRKSPNRQ